MARTVQRSSSTNPIVSKLRLYLTLRGDEAAAKTAAERIKAELSEFADVQGVVDEEKGHKVVGFDDPIEVGGKLFTGFMKQRRVSQVFEEEKAEALLAAKGLKKSQYMSTQTFVDQDKVYRLYAEDILSEEEMESLITEKETFAFVPVKDA